MKLSIRNIFLWIAAAAVVLFGMTMTAYADEYDLWVGGTQVTDGNLNDIPAAEGETKTGTASFDPATKTLTLNNYKYEGKGLQSSLGKGSAINALFEDEFVIELIGNNVVKVKNDNDSAGVNINYGIYSSNDLSIQGEGSLYVSADNGKVQNFGIATSDDTLTIAGACTLNAHGGSGDCIHSYGIYSDSIYIKDNCTVNAYGGNCKSTENSYSYGVRIQYDVNITGGTVKATGGNASVSKGIQTPAGTITIAPEGDFIDFEASGGTVALNGNVLNKIPGVGWTDVQGEGEGVDIPEKENAEPLGYNKVRFGIYPLWVGGTKVTVKNLDDIPAAEGETRGGR